MKKTVISICITTVFLCAITLMAGNKNAGEKCIGDADCEFHCSCKSGVCVKKKEFNFGGSDKVGKPCNIDADCIGAGECVEGDFGKKYCSGE
jgi:hypothetical protein